MLEGRGQPLDVAKLVLSERAMRAVGKDPFDRFGWAILDRWAMNSPEALKALEARSVQELMQRVFKQQEIERQAILFSPDEATQGLADHEILAAQGIQTELVLDLG